MWTKARQRTASSDATKQTTPASLLYLTTTLPEPAPALRQNLPELRDEMWKLIVRIASSNL